MITPNKVVALDNSALGLSWLVLEALQEHDSVSEVQRRTARDFESIDQFLLTIDLLFVLEKIDVDFETGRIFRVD